MTASMQLRVVTPSAIVLDEPVNKIVAEAPNGYFALLPRHIDFVSELVASVITFITAQGVERFLAVNQGTLLKNGQHVVVATRDAIVGDDLAVLEHQVRVAFRQLDEQERTARSALARLEAAMVRRFIDLDKVAQ